MSSVTAGVSND